MRMKRIGINVIILAAFVLSLMVLPASAGAKGPKPPPGGGSGGESSITCNLPESNAEALEILAYYYPGYWWDHTDLTIAVKSAPNVPTKHLRAINAAIETWSDVLADCFDGAITLTNVTGTHPSEQKAADIVVHYVPKAGGVSFEGYAICGAKDCPNVLVKSDAPGEDEFSPEYVGWVTLHEVGHALGLGHTTNLWESYDLMGYGWPDLGDPVLSQCDIEGIAYVFAWAFDGSEPYPPAQAEFVCS